MECIPPRWVCDGAQDCKDGSDEHECKNTTTAKISSTCLVSKGHFLCGNGTCLDPKFVCNNKTDCPNGEEEGDHCNYTCAKHRCSQKCMRTPEGPACYCNPGFHLSKDNKTCLDIDECRVEGYCSQKCQNKLGGAVCSCYDGYSPVNNSCLALGEDPLLIFSDSISIVALPLRNAYKFPIIHHKSSTFGLDFDIVENRVYWTKSGPPKNASIVSVNIRSSDDVRNEVSIGLENPQDIRIDWVARNIYIVDHDLGSIIVCKLKAELCLVLVENITNPRALVLDPPSGFMYWSAWGKDAAIYKQGMDGSQKTLFVSKHLIWPNGLALDKVGNMLYWADDKDMSISRITLNGLHRKKIVHSRIFRPHSIAVFEDYIYWTDWDKFSIERCNKFTGKNHVTLHKDVNTPFGTVTVVHPVLYGNFNNNPCRMSVCSHLCLIAPGGGYTCACITGFFLSSDERTCLVDLDAPRLYLMEDRNIYQIATKAANNNKPFPVPVVTGPVADLTYDPETRVLYIGENEKQRISAVHVANYSKKVVIEGAISEITGLDYDYEGGNIFWTDGDKGTIEVVARNGSFRKTLVGGLTRPIDIALHPERGLMFVAVLRYESKVLVFDMTGENRRKINEADGFYMSVFVDRSGNRLYWGDTFGERILMRELEPGSSSQIAVRNTGHVISIAVDDRNIYWLDGEHRALNFVTKNLNPKTVIYGNQDKLHVNRKLVYVNPLITKKGTCAASRCTQLCLLSPSGYVCSCRTGFTLSSDKRSCEVVANCSSTSFRCGNGKCIAKDKKCDGRTDCLDGTDEVDCPLTCGGGDFHCANGRCINMRWQCDGTNDCEDNSDEENCASTKQILPAYCPPTHIRCKNGSCVPPELLCDLTPNCPDGDDENVTYCASRQCPHKMMRCNSGQCIPDTWKCDGEKDCFDNTDEDNCSKALTCNADEFRCEDLCIPKSLVCDTFDDCLLGEDEINCSHGCPKGKFKCQDGKTCIYQKDRCDKIKDCPDGDDELDCSVKCEDFEFSCHSGECIPSSWQCDGGPDCADGSDEDLPQCHHTTVTTTSSSPLKFSSCPDTMFRCQSGTCITLDRVCDGKADCYDFSDEGDHCKDTCGSNNHGCAHICVHGPEGPFCQCHEGFELGADKMSCLDVDECQQLGSCSHFCRNTKGGYICTCYDGYSLQHNGACKAIGGISVLLMLVRNDIRSIDLLHHHESILVKDINNIKEMDFVDSEDDSVIIWGDAEKKSIMYFSLKDLTMGVLLNTSDDVILVAYDWVGLNYYYVCDYSIHVCNNKAYCATLLDNEKINTFTLVPTDGIMFIGLVNAISKMEMDGSNYQEIVSHKVVNPSAIAVDQILKHTYWVEFKRDVISSVDYNGANLRIVTSKAKLPFALSLFEDYLYWSEWESNHICKCNKFNCGDPLIIAQSGSIVRQLLVFHPVLRQRVRNPCQQSPCDHLCLLKNNNPVCKCSDGFNLVSGRCEETCTPDYCYNEGLCKIVGTTKHCNCLIGYEGERCENEIQSMTANIEESANRWIAGAIIGIILVVVIIAFTYLCLKDKTTIRNRGRNIIVSFRHSFLQKEEPLIIDSEYSDPIEKTRPTESDLYNKTEVNGSYKKWRNLDNELDRSPNWHRL